jgi:hypothetical protein
MKPEAGPPRLVYPHVTLESRSPWLLGSYSCQLFKSCADANMVCLVLRIEVAAGVRKAFSNAYRDRNAEWGNSTSTGLEIRRAETTTSAS